jgi:hypothetical protein
VRAGWVTGNPEISCPCCLSWGFAALRGLGPGGPGRLWVSVRPLGVSTPLGWSSSEPSDRPKPSGGPPCAFVPLQRRVLTAPHRGEHGSSRDASFPGLPFPTTHAGSADPLCWWQRIPPPPRATYGVWLPPSRPAPPILPMPKHRSVPGIRPPRRSPRRERCPSRGPCPPDVPDPRPPLPREERSRGRGRLQGLVPTTSPCRRPAAARQPDRRCLPGLRPSRAFPPSVRAIASSHDAGPLALGRDDVPTHLDHRASRIEWIGLVRFRTAGSPGVLHLPTVAALRSPFRGAGSWLRLAQEVT